MKDKLDDFIDGVEHLPPSPRALVRLLELFKQPHQDVHEIVRLLTHDPSFTVEVLKRCNSAYFTGAKPADDMFEAVTRLGLQEIYSIVLAMFAMSAILKDGAGANSHVEILWRHSVAVAVAAGVIAEETREDHATAFTAGLLHDIGKVVLVSANKDRYAQAVLDAGLFRRPILATEKHLFGFDHCEVGARLLIRWELPPNIVAAVRHHHHPGDAGNLRISPRWWRSPTSSPMARARNFPACLPACKMPPNRWPSSDWPPTTPSACWPRCNRPLKKPAR